MCTAITMGHYFGRTLDVEQNYGQSLVVSPRNLPFSFATLPTLEHHFALIGTAFLNRDLPLYFDATNERGLSMAGLNFPGLCKYQPYDPNKINLTPSELFFWLLGQCSTVEEVLEKLQNVQLLDHGQLSPLHFLVADPKRSIVLEPMADGLHIHENPVGVLTNCPDFPYHLYRLRDFLNLSADPVENRFAPEVPLDPYCLGLSAVGLPGDLSSASRFVKVAFHKLHSPMYQYEKGVSQFFHVLSSVNQQKGPVLRPDGKYEFTAYTSCCDAAAGKYYYTTYENHQISCVDLWHCDVDGEKPISYPMESVELIRFQN